MMGSARPRGAAASGTAGTSPLLVLIHLPGLGRILKRNLDSVGESLHNLRLLQAHQSNLHVLLLEEALPDVGHIQLSRTGLPRLLLSRLGGVEGLLQNVGHLSV